MTDQCFGRIMRDKKENRGYFGTTTNRFFFEYRCPNKVEEGELCSRCVSWKQKGVNKKDPYRAHYGLVTEPIDKDSRFFGSAWFESKVKQYGQPSEDDMARAKKAQETARKDIVVQAPPVVVEQPPVKTSKRTRKPKQAPAPVPLPPQPPVPDPEPDPEPPAPPHPPPKPLRKRTVNPKSTVQIQAIEASPQLTDLEVIKIVVRPFQVNETNYFRDVTKNKLYSVGKDKRPSTYVGRWNPETESIDTEFPDSDAE